MLLDQSFYFKEDVVQIAKELLGKVIFTQIDGQYTSGIITETEAYAGISDKASHAYGNRRTSRTEIMFGKGGHAYVYLCYGIHSLFNIVTNLEGVPHAVLLRGIYPLDGKSVMEQRRSKKFTIKGFSDGPGKVSQALGIDLQLNAKPLNGKLIGIKDMGYIIPENLILVGPRVGVDYAGEDALLPFRFLFNGSVWAQKNLLTQ